METEKLAACHEGTVASAKEVQRRLSSAGIESVLATKQGCGTHAGGCGCGGKVQVLVREQDAAHVQRLWRDEWHQALAAEGVVLPSAPPLSVVGAEEGDLPCPACGTAAPLVAGACSDCGLQLE